MPSKLKDIFNRLNLAFGDQHWWPADSAFEVILGAILAQNTSWTNVEKAIAVLKSQGLLAPKKLLKLPLKKLAVLIKSAGYYNLKAKRIKNFLEFFYKRYHADPRLMRRINLVDLRRQLLEINGVGPETADSILLYALEKPIFVVDSYTKRIFSRHHLIKEAADYALVQAFLMRNLKPDVKLFGQYHALLVKLGKDFCRKSNPQCKICPLWSIKNV